MTRLRSPMPTLLILAAACTLFACAFLALSTPQAALAEDDPAGAKPTASEDPTAQDDGVSAAEEEARRAIAAESLDASFSGAGTQANPYLISDADMLVEFAQLYNRNSFPAEEDLYVELSEDIDLAGVDWEPIGNSKASPFVGHFNGAGHTITNLKIADSVENGMSDRYYAYGLFGYVAQGEISKLQVDVNVSVSAKPDGIPCAGALAGVVAPFDGAEVLIEDCSGTGTLTVSGGELALAGGLVGCASLSGTDQNVRIFGGGTMTTVSVADSAQENCAGGLVGSITVDALNSNLAVSGCEVFDPVSVKQNTPAGSGGSILNEAGGLAGALYLNGEGSSIALIECPTSGEVSAEGDVTYNDAGGLVGSAEVAGGYLKYENCSAAGTVKASGSANDAKEAAEEANGSNGLFGGGEDESATSGSSSAKMRNLHETGNDTGGAVGYMKVTGGTVEILGLGTSGSVNSTGTMAQNDGGGLIGYLDLQYEGSTISLSACSAGGDVEVYDGIANNAGGLVGWADVKDNATFELTYSSARGAVNAQNGTENYAGGVLGNVEISDASSFSLNDCSSQSDVSGSGEGTYSEAGGLVGSIYCFDAAQAAVYSCYTTGTAEAKDADENYAGGLVGSIYAESGSNARVNDCYALGDASASGFGDSNDAGGLIGYACADQSSVSVATSYAAGNTSASGATQLFNNAAGIVGSVDCLGAETSSLLVTGCVALGESVRAADSAANTADRILASLGAESTGGLVLERNFAWEDISVDGGISSEDGSDPAANGASGSVDLAATEGGEEAAGQTGTEAGTNDGESESAPTLLDPAFWSDSQSGPGFDDEGIWTVQEGQLPLLTNVQAAAYTPAYLAPADTPEATTPEEASQPDFEEYASMASRILLGALGCLAVFLIGRTVYRRSKRKNEEGRQE